MSEEQEDNPAPIVAPAKPKTSALRVVLYLLILLLMLAAIAGMIVAATSKAIDPASVQPPVITKQMIKEDQAELTAPVVAAKPAMTAAPLNDVPKSEAPKEDDQQTDAPLELPSQKGAPLLSKKNIAPQSMIKWPPEKPGEKPLNKSPDKMLAQIPINIGKNTPQIAIIIDDMGLAQKNSREMATLEPALTLSYMPYAEHLSEQTKTAYSNGHELIVHMPMEPDDIKHNNPGPDALLTTNSAEENVARLNRNLSKFNGYIGMNNHMGSRMTASETAMRPVMQAFKEKGLWFLDSRTIGNSVAAKLAAEMHVPYAERDVFLDNTETVPAILKQLQQVEQIARKKGYVIAIGHPYSQTIAALRQWVPQAKQQGFKLVPLSTIISERFPTVPLPHYARTQQNISVATH